MRKKKIKYDIANNGLEAVEKWASGGYHLILVRLLPSLSHSPCVNTCIRWIFRCQWWTASRLREKLGRSSAKSRSQASRNLRRSLKARKRLRMVQTEDQPCRRTGLPSLLSLWLPHRFKRIEWLASPRDATISLPNRSHYFGWITRSSNGARSRPCRCGRILGLTQWVQWILVKLLRRGAWRITCGCHRRGRRHHRRRGLLRWKRGRKQC